MSPKLYRAADVCELTQLQPYVLRSWEKEFPGIGVQRALDGPRFYRQQDVDHVLRIKQLVFSEGLTLSGARRRLEEAAPPPVSAGDVEAAEVLDALASDARARVAFVRDGLRSILQALSSAPGARALGDDYRLTPVPVAAPKTPARKAAAKARPPSRTKGRVLSKSGAGTKAKPKRARASA